MSYTPWFIPAPWWWSLAPQQWKPLLARLLRPELRAAVLGKAGMSDWRRFAIAAGAVAAILTITGATGMPRFDTAAGRSSDYVVVRPVVPAQTLKGGVIELLPLWVSSAPGRAPVAA